MIKKDMLHTRIDGFKVVRFMKNDFFSAHYYGSIKGYASVKVCRLVFLP